MLESLEYYSNILGVLQDVQATEWGVTRYVEGSGHEGTWRYSVNVNDVFAWACADAEALEPLELQDWEQAWKDSPSCGGMLWVARKRKMRPQGAIYKVIPYESWHLFDEAGPARDVGLGNPITSETILNAQSEEQLHGSVEPVVAFRDQYPIADKVLLELVPLFSYFTEFYDLGIPRIKDNSEVLVACYEDYNLEPSDILNAKEFLKLAEQYAGDEETIWDNFGKLSELID